MTESPNSHLFMELGKYSRVIVDDHNVMWQLFEFPESLNVSKPRFWMFWRAPSCRVLCGGNWNRTHLGCPWCRLQRAYFNKVPRKIKVVCYLQFLKPDTGRIVSRVRRVFLSVAETLSNI